MVYVVNDTRGHVAAVAPVGLTHHKSGEVGIRRLGSLSAPWVLGGVQGGALCPLAARRGPALRPLGDGAMDETTPGPPVT